MEGFAEVEDNKVTILCNGAEEGSSIDPKTAQEELEKVTLLVDEATTKKEKIEATIELRKSKARLQAVSKFSKFKLSLVTFPKWERTFLEKTILLMLT